MGGVAVAGRNDPTRAGWTLPASEESEDSDDREHSEVRLDRDRSASLFWNDRLPT